MLNLKLIAISAAIAFIFGLGITSGYKYQQGRIDKLKQQHNEQIQAIENEAERDLKERQDQIDNLQREFAIADSKYLEDMKNVQIENDRLAACVRSGKCVPTVKVKRQVCAADRKDSNSKTLDGTSRAELDPETAIRIYRITDDGDAAIKQLNELQNRVRQLILVCPIEIL
jgi:Bacteriophage Rz lysis protein